MIKKILGLLITCIGIINITSAYNFLHIEIELPGSYINSGIEYYISNNGNFKSTYGRSLYLKDSENEYTIFWNNGQLYLYGTWQNYYQGQLIETIKKQGYLTKYCKYSGYNQDGCRYNLNTETAEEFYNLTNVNFTKLGLSLTAEGDSPGICFYNETNNTTYCTAPMDANNAGTRILSGSLSIPENTTDFKNYTQYKEFENSNETRTDNANAIINTQCPTIGQVMKTFGSNYNTGSCYNNTRYFNGTTFETIDQQDIFTIFNNDYENYTNRVSIYQQTCRPPATTQACQTAFSGEYKKYSIIANAYNSNVDEKKLRNYCNMGLNYNPNTSTCIASGYIKEDYTPEERLESIIGTENEIPTPNTNLFNSICEGNECYKINRNFFESLINIYEKLTGLFRERNGIEGIIPPYIIRITFVTILFTIIFKK